MRIWKISPWNKGVDWNYFRNEGIIYTGDFKVPDLHDLRKFSSEKDIINFLEKTGNSLIKGVRQQLWPFFEKATINDIVIAYSDRKIWGIGKITGGYYYDDKNNKHKWPVEWSALQPPLVVNDDRFLYGTPPSTYGVLNKKATIIELKENEWKYLLNNFRQIVETFNRINR